MAKKSRHNPDEVAILMDVQGTCRKCRHRGQARLVVYYSREVIVRCNHCHTANQFDIDGELYNDPHWFEPWLGDENGEDLESPD